MSKFFTFSLPGSFSSSSSAAIIKCKFRGVIGEVCYGRTSNIFVEIYSFNISFLYRNASLGGMFIACMNALDQLKVEGGVDIFQIVRRIKISQSEFVGNAVSVNLFYSQCLYSQFAVIW